MKNKFFNSLLCMVILSVLLTSASISFVLELGFGDIYRRILPITLTLIVVFWGIFLGLLRYFRGKSAGFFGKDPEEGRTESPSASALDKNKDSAQLQQEMYSNVSHEMKTPLTTIHGYAEMMANGMVSPEDVPMIAEKMREESDHLLVLIDRMMEGLRHPEERPTLKHESVDLQEIALRVGERLRPLAEKKQIDLQTEVTSVVLWSDPDMLEQICYNLVDNAIKYTYHGGLVKVCVGQAADGKYLSVSDNGIGISEEDQKRIFERFFRGDRSHSRHVDGNGLGLAIVKHHVDALGGKLVLHSAPGKGTEIRVFFAEF